MNNKMFRTLDEQIDILRSKGLIINDVDKAKDILLRENYFFINGYRQIFKKSYKDPLFINGTTFDELYGMFLFDRKFRNIMFKYLLVIENNMKSIVSYQLSKKYGYKEKDYLNPQNFTQDTLKSRQVKDVLSKMRRQIRVNGRQHKATMHYIDNYGYIPMWILVKVLSFGIVAELFSILKYEDQSSISSIYRIEPETMNIYLSILSNYRNLCAHEDILFDNRTQREIPNNIVHEILNIESDDYGYKYGKNDLFALVIIMKDMLTEGEFRDLINEVSYEVDILDGKVDSVSLDSILNRIGFPSNWHDIINIK